MEARAISAWTAAKARCPRAGGTRASRTFASRRSTSSFHAAEGVGSRLPARRLEALRPESPRTVVSRDVDDPAAHDRMRLAARAAVLPDRAEGKRRGVRARDVHEERVFDDRAVVALLVANRRSEDELGPPLGVRSPVDDPTGDIERRGERSCWALLDEPRRHPFCHAAVAEDEVGPGAETGGGPLAEESAEPDTVAEAWHGQRRLLCACLDGGAREGVDGERVAEVEEHALGPILGDRGRRRGRRDDADGRNRRRARAGAEREVDEREEGEQPFRPHCRASEFTHASPRTPPPATPVKAPSPAREQLCGGLRGTHRVLHVCRRRRKASGGDMCRREVGLDDNGRGRAKDMWGGRYQRLRPGLHPELGLRRRSAR
jgi:hypothetical protein